MEFAVSILLLDGKAGLGHLTDAVVKREDVQGMLRRTNFHVDPEFNKTEGGARTYKRFWWRMEQSVYI